MSKTSVCVPKTFNFLAQVCCTFAWQRKLAFPGLIFLSTSTVLWSSLCVQHLSFHSLTGWKSLNCERIMTLCFAHLLSPWIWLSQWATWPLMQPFTHNPTPVDRHSFWLVSQMVLQVLCGLQWSEWVSDCVSEGLSIFTANRERWKLFALISVLSRL